MQTGDTCATCDNSKQYAEERIRKGQVYCKVRKGPAHANSVCEDYKRNNVKHANAWKRTAKMRKSGKCARCHFSEYAHGLRGMANKVCAEFVAPENVQQSELFPLVQIEKKERHTTMDVEQ